MKRKFKILILAVSVIAMLLAFAITSSAASRDVSEICEDNDYWNIYDSITMRYYGMFYSSTGLQMEVTLDFEEILDNGAEALIEDIIEDLENDPDDGRYTLQHFGSFTRFEYEEVRSAVIEELTNFKALLEKKYSQSDIDNAVDKYKASEEYTLILNNKYLTGYTEGMDSFKASDAYTNALDLEYSNGKIAGITEYKSSTEYANALKAEYNEGYDNGVTDTQGENTDNTKNDTTKLISILIGVLGFGILCMGVFSAVGAFKKKRAKRR